MLRLRVNRLGSVLLWFGLALLLAAPRPVSPIPSACILLVEAAAANPRLYWHPSAREVSQSSNERPRGLYILAYEIGQLSEPKQVDALKADMMAGHFDYQYSRYSTYGFYHERYRTIFITEGHHRFVAALEVAYETGDWTPFNRLVAVGVWQRTENVPATARNLPFRSSYWLPSKWRTFVNELRPPTLTQEL